MSKSSEHNDKGTVFCKNGHMFYKDSFISNRTATCDENANWSFNSTNLHCYKGLVLVTFKLQFLDVHKNL